MTRQITVGVVLIAVSILGERTAGVDPGQNAASAATKASPELVGALSKEIGGTPDQAAGAAGSLFGIAKSRLKNPETGPGRQE